MNNNTAQYSTQYECALDLWSRSCCSGPKPEGNECFPKTHQEITVHRFVIERHALCLRIITAPTCCQQQVWMPKCISIWRRSIMANVVQVDRCPHQYTIFCQYLSAVKYKTVYCIFNDIHWTWPWLRDMQKYFQNLNLEDNDFPQSPFQSQMLRSLKDYYKIRIKIMMVKNVLLMNPMTSLFLIEEKERQNMCFAK